MSLVAELLIFGWTTTLTMIGLCALSESGELLRIHRRIGRWLEKFAPSSVAAPNRDATRWNQG